ncbi:MAG: ABC transporter substrate-binding protein [Candidatus Omnitrophica bacterium]|nr:ABC transporter substrate-binding protein [Candidatus Omnitrophota bacterium]
MKRTIAFSALAFLFLASSASTETAPLKKVSFIPQWAPQAQFAGYYVAYEKGFYKKYGLDVTIINGGPDRLPSDYLKEGKADFATLWLSTGIEERSQGVKLVSLAQIIQRSALMLIAKASRGITKPEDLNGKKVGLWPSIYQIQPRAFFKKYNLDVKIIPQSYSVNLFLRDGVDAVSAMWFNEYHTIVNSGYDPEELTSFFFYDYGLNFPEDGIYTLEETFEKDPASCAAFVRASLEGWQYAFEHPDEALDIVLKYMREAHVPANRMHQKWMLERMRDLLSLDDSGVPSGILSPADYNRVAEKLKESDTIKEIPDFKVFFKGYRDYGDK